MKLDLNKSFELYEGIVSELSSEKFVDASSIGKVASLSTVSCMDKESQAFFEGSDKASLKGMFESAMLKAGITEAPSTSQAQAQTFTKLILPVLSRSGAAFIAQDKIVNVTRLTGPVGQVNYLRRIIGNSNGTNEALFTGLTSAIGGTGTHANTHDPFVDGSDVDTTPADGVADNFSYGTGWSTVDGEALGEVGGTAIQKISNRIDKVTITAGTRKLQSVISLEAIEDAIAESNIDFIRESIFTASKELERGITAETYARILKEAKLGTTFNFSSIAADDAQVLADKGVVLYKKMQDEALQISRETLEPGLRFNAFVSPAVLSRLRLVSQLNVNIPTTIKMGLDMSSFYAGTIGIFDVYVDMYATKDYVCVVGKGDTMATAPLMLGTYVPIQMIATQDIYSNQQVITFRTRYGIVTNPLATDTPGASNGVGVANGNRFARKFLVTNA